MSAQIPEPLVFEDKSLDPDEVMRSMNGFDEIAVSNMFRQSIGELASASETNATMLFRAFLFVLARRGGMKDGDAYRGVMNLRVDYVVERFREGDAPGEASKPDEIENGPISS